MIQRLLELMRIKDLTSSQLADAIKVQRSGISHFVSGRNKPSMEFILKILSYFPDVNPDWLLFGKDPMFRKPVQFSKEVSVQENRNENEPGLMYESTGGQQSSFLEGLFPGQDSLDLPPKADINELSEDQAIKQEKSRKKEIRIPKKDPGGEVQLSGDEAKDGSAERIVIFYKNRSFREYFPE